MKTDEMRITILSDGTIKLDADAISMPSHNSAEAFVNEVARLAGGTTTKKMKHKHGHHGAHSHHHGESHHEH